MGVCGNAQGGEREVKTDWVKYKVRGSKYEVKSTKVEVQWSK